MNILKFHFIKNIVQPIIPLLASKLTYKFNKKPKLHETIKNPNYFIQMEDKYGCHNYHPLPVVL